MNFHTAQNWLKKLETEAKFFHKSTPPTLETTQKILDELGRPDEFFIWRVVVGGTAGKGTICRRTAATLAKSGKKVATISSPHLQSVIERIRLGENLISPSALATALATVRLASERIAKKPTFYEAIVLAGIVAAKNFKAEILILEIGCGGEFDAANAVRGDRIAALSFIGDDHREVLGGTLAKIAETKSKIFTPDSKLNLTFEQNFCSILEKTAKTPVHFLKGVKSKMNKKIARKIVEKILNSTSFELQNPKLPARWEKIEIHASKFQKTSHHSGLDPGSTLKSFKFQPEFKIRGADSGIRLDDEKKPKNSSVDQSISFSVILDAAHSRPRFEFILPKIKKLRGQKILLAAMTKNHNPANFEVILPEFDEIFWIDQIPGTAREFHPAKFLRDRAGRGVADFKTPQSALRATSDQFPTAKIIVIGSFFLAGSIRELAIPTEKILQQQTEFPKI